MPICSECGKDFPAAGRKAACSPECAKQRARKRRGIREGGDRDESGRLIKACAMCGAEFQAASGRKTCSQECHDEARRQKDRDFKRAKWANDPEAERTKQAERIARQREADPEGYRRKERERWSRRRTQPIATCNRCGKQFQAKRKDAQFCSEECAAPSIDIDCHHCGRRFTGRRGQNYCSTGCSRESTNEQKRLRERQPAVDLETSLVGLAISVQGPDGKYACRCQICGSEFRSQRHNASACSAECRKERERQRPRKRSETKLRQRKCVVCDKQFAGRKNAKTCSKECRTEYHRRTETERAKAPEVRERQKWLARERRGVDARCIVCDRDMSDLPDLRANRYTCSEDCRNESLRRRNRRSYERRRNRDQQGEHD
jgi:hypothetical protein